MLLSQDQFESSEFFVSKWNKILCNIAVDNVSLEKTKNSSPSRKIKESYFHTQRDSTQAQ